MYRTITSISRDFKILNLLQESNDLKFTNLSAMLLKYWPASNILGEGIEIPPLFFCMEDLNVAQSPYLKQCVQINQPKTIKFDFRYIISDFFFFF